MAIHIPNPFIETIEDIVKRNNDGANQEKLSKYEINNLIALCLDVITTDKTKMSFKTTDDALEFIVMVKNLSASKLKTVKKTTTFIDKFSDIMFNAYMDFNNKQTTNVKELTKEEEITIIESKCIEVISKFDGKLNGITYGVSDFLYLLTTAIVEKVIMPVQLEKRLSMLNGKAAMDYIYEGVRKEVDRILELKSSSDNATLTTLELIHLFIPTIIRYATALIYGKLENIVKRTDINDGLVNKINFIESSITGLTSTLNAMVHQFNVNNHGAYIHGQQLQQQSMYQQPTPTMSNAGPAYSQRDFNRH